MRWFPPASVILLAKSNVQLALWAMDWPACRLMVNVVSSEVLKSSVFPDPPQESVTPLLTVVAFIAVENTKLYVDATDTPVALPLLIFLLPGLPVNVETVGADAVVNP